MLDEVFKKKWVAALRSGKYKQGKGYLKKNRGEGHGGTTYCCLGVAREIDKRLKGDGNALLNDKSCVLIGLNKFKQPEFTNMNDDQELTFKEIADIIEKRY